MLTHTLERHFVQDLSQEPLLEDFTFHTQAKVKAVHIKFTEPVTEIVTISRVDARLYISPGMGAHFN